MTALGTRPGLPHRRRAWLLGVVVPTAITLVAVALLVTWAPRLPDLVVVHWGGDGPDATGSLASLVLPFAVYGGVSLVVCGLFAVLTGRTSMVRRMTAGIATGMAALNAGLVLGAVHVQLDAALPAEVADPMSRIALAMLLAVVIGVLAAALAGGDPPLPSSSPLPADGTRAALDHDDAPIWEVRATVSRAGRVASWTGAAGLVVLAVGLGAVTSSWWLGAIMLVPVPLVLLFLSWRVRVDATGLTVQSTLGRPRQHVPAEEVDHAEVVEVSPLSEFGGWGLRIAPDLHGTVGVVVRSGEAIRVCRSGERRFVVTVDDAATGAALLNTYAARARS
ncbi:DUF1648 domain-containing protein [Georgenia sp. MJ170]|uniref:DUF1648 domain-containing protein n=1 Tax=Georgenia sunbinii TaxID=3117728 RepID=UPI002F261172